MVKKREFIKGSTDSVFLVVARKGAAILAVRPLANMVEGKKVVLGLRVRCEYDPTVQTVVGVIPYLEKQFPLQYVNTSIKHSSITIAAEIRKTKEHLAYATSGETSLARAAMVKIQEKSGFGGDIEDAIAYLEEFYKDAISVHFSQTDDNVVSLKSKTK